MSTNQRRRQEQQQKNIAAFRKPININLGIVFFAVIFIYLCFYFITYAGQTKIRGYQVVTGSLSENTIYRGIAIRSEREFYADDAGYVNYYAGEGIKSGCGNLVYTLDATGALAEMLADSEKSNLTDDELNSIKSEIMNFNNEFITSDFASVYDFKRSLNSLVSRYRTTNIMDNIHALNAASNSAEVRLIRAETSGIVVYSHDGYEDLTIDTVSVQNLKEEDYNEDHFSSNRLVASGDLIYKMITSEDWYVAIEIDELTANRLMDETYLEVRFLKTQTTSWATSEVRYTGDGILLLLGFNNSMITFAKDRFIDIELVLNQETGLKIPNSAIEEKEFYVIPKEFITKGSDQSEGALVERYNENGERELIYTELNIYYVTDEYYYVSKENLSAGTYLYNPHESFDKETLLDSDEIRDSYEQEQTSSVGILSNEVNEGDEVTYNEDGEPIVIPAGSVTGDTGEVSGDDHSDTLTQDSEASDTEADQSEPESLDTADNNESSDSVNSYAHESKIAVGMTGTLIGVYNMNKGYADFRQITILYQNDEYAIVKPNTMYGLCEYDYIVLDASSVSDNDLIY